MDIVSTQLRIPASLLKQVRHEAVEMGVSGNAAILILLREALGSRRASLHDDASINEWGDKRGRGYRPEVIARLQEGVRALKVAYVYAQRADWLFSGDDGEKSFLERLEKELSKCDAQS